MGSLIGTSLPSLFTLVVGAMLLGEDFLGAVLVMAMPFLIGLVAAAAGLVLVGLPMTVWLKRRGEESRRAYVSGGLIGGGIVAFAVSWGLFGGSFFGAVFIAAFGAFTGGATGHFWWRYARREEAEQGLDEIAEVFG